MTIQGPEDDFETTITDLLDNVPPGDQVTSTFDFSTMITKDFEPLFQSSSDSE